MSSPTAFFLKPGPHQQQCRSNIVECYNFECCFNIVAVFGNNVEAKTATMSNEFCVEMSSFRQSRTLLRQCCPKRQHCRSNRQQSCLLLRQCCFDIVASVDRALVRPPLQASIPPRYVTNHPGQLSLLPSVGREDGSFHSWISVWSLVNPCRSELHSRQGAIQMFRLNLSLNEEDGRQARVTASTDLSPDRFFWATRFLILFFPYFSFMGRALD